MWDKIKEWVFGPMPSDKNIINYIGLQISKGYNSYTTIKDHLTKKYRDMSDSELREEREVFKARKVALQSIGFEGHGGLSIAILACGVATFGNFINFVAGLEQNKVIGYFNEYFILFQLTLFCLIFTLVCVQVKMTQKAKKLAYYEIVLEVIEEEIEKRKQASKALCQRTGEDLSFLSFSVGILRKIRQGLSLLCAE